MDKKEYCYYCFEVVAATLEHRKVRDKWNAKSWTRSIPLFVKFASGKGHDKQLRGCIGTFRARPLVTNLTYFSKQAAFCDERFRPISLGELALLECQIDLLVDFEPIDDPLDWEVGIHGVSIKFTANGIRYSSTYLPSVAAEQRWDQEETLESLIHKAGYYGSIRSLQITATRYKSLEIGCTYEEYLHNLELLG
ncbi:AMMECR1 domain-containing protein [Schizosaccharomyces pombe]|uniref:Uncharacterized protein C688.03c n=1 Tax=Schizosaccharomyces pombe (strain 972 / ATCC 24843) TaxID=284812 RepID=YKQ3_SCHPO|nr:AMMECR1 family protein [Schizosaccharomyces pombe]Q9P6M2.2 RecName: Full=Uncharacterized protein C688.03c [Schizosaccharomyces pombe 972h-]CAB90770.2 human AMMECR1 homolog [Schizosaccharomyces pombe]|eukprot:NP_594062.2 AMMECR1 family protein [Schizosaccharomyces pombe]